MELLSLVASLTLDAKDYEKGMEEAQKTADGFTIETPKIPKPDTDDFDKGVKEAEGIGGTFKEVMTGVWDGIKDTIVVSGITTAVMAVVGAMRQGITIAAETGDAVAKGAKNYHMSVREYQELNYTLTKSNLKMTDLKKAMSSIDKIKAGKATKDQAEYLGKLNLNAEDASFSLETLMTALHKYTEEDKGAIIEAFFGSSEKWDGYFDQTEADIKKIKKEAADLGVIMSDEAVKNAEAFTDSTERLSTTLQSIQRSFGEGVLPLLTEATNTVAKIVAFFSGGQEGLSERWKDDNKGLAEELQSIEETSAAAMYLADKLGSMGDTSKMTAEQYENWRATAQALIDMIPQLDEVINTDTGEILGNTESIKNNILEWERLAKTRALNDLKAKKSADLLGENEDVLAKLIEVNRAESKVDTKRKDAITAMNDLLKDEVNGGFFKQMSGLESVDLSNFEQALKFFSAYENEAGDAAREYNKSVDELAQITSEWETAQSQLQSAKDDYADWEAAANEVLATITGDAGSATDAVNQLETALDNLPSEKHVSVSVDGALPEGAYADSDAKGNWRVPYDNFPALLHRDEMVLSKSQARQLRDGAGGYSAGVGEMVSSSVEKAMSKVYVMLSGEKVGDLTTKRIDRNINAKTFRKLRAMGG